MEQNQLHYPASRHWLAKARSLTSQKTPRHCRHGAAEAIRIKSFIMHMEYPAVWLHVSIRDHWYSLHPDMLSRNSMSQSPHSYITYWDNVGRGGPFRKEPPTPKNRWQMDWQIPYSGPSRTNYALKSAPDVTAVPLYFSPRDAVQRSRETTVHAGVSLHPLSRDAVEENVGVTLYMARLHERRLPTTTTRRESWRFQKGR